MACSSSLIHGQTKSYSWSRLLPETPGVKARVTVKVASSRIPVRLHFTKSRSSTDNLNFHNLMASGSYAGCRPSGIPVSMRVGSSMDTPDLQRKSATVFKSNKDVEITTDVSAAQHVNPNLRSHEQFGPASQFKRTAKIHDFCLGIPFGVVVLSEGICSFLFSKNFTSAVHGLLYGGIVLALCSLSLKVWRQGRSSLLFILGQTVLTAVILWKHFLVYMESRQLFPAGFFVVVSAAMLCFYTYVMVCGGNPPSKKLKLNSSSLS